MCGDSSSGSGRDEVSGEVRDRFFVVRIVVFILRAKGSY